MESTTRKRKRVSKNKKKNWRKHIDINDVEEFLEEERLQLRTGGLAAEKTDSQLFFVDKAVEDEIEKGEPVAPKRKKKETKLLKCHANLHTTGVKPAVIPRKINSNSVKKLSERKRKKIENNILNSREKQSKLHRSLAVKVAKVKRITRNKLQNTNFDLWAGDCVNDNVKEVEEYHNKCTKKTKPKAPQHLRTKPSVVPAVEVSHPGASYNPAYDDHQELLHMANEVEVIKMKDEAKLERKMAPMQKMSWNQMEQSWLEEMSAGLGGEEEEDGEDQEGESEDGDEDDLAINPPVRRENKKTEKQRKKEMLEQEREKTLKDMKMKKMKESQQLRLKSIKKEVNSVLKQREAKATRKAEKRKAAITNPKKLGKLKYEAPDLELHLTEELKGSLRLLKPEGHLLEDRFRSFQRRNIIEPRKRTKHIKWTYKPKSYEKKDHKAITA